jgi:hypothetical protein
MRRRRVSTIEQVYHFVHRVLMILFHCFATFAIIAWLIPATMQRIARFFGATADVTVLDMVSVASGCLVVMFINQLFLAAAEED